MKTRLHISIATLMSLILVGVFASGLYSPLRTTAAPPPTPASKISQTNSVAAAVSPPKKVSTKRGITGAELYSMNCNRCHPERYPTERTAAQWKTIMLHMQVRANLPVSQAKLILKYLQDNSGR
jgi:hypothetical protein